ncbi:MAG: aldo/keto reductase [Myxococcota bacterium]
MRTIRFGRTEARVPVVSMGTWSHGGPNTAGERSVGWSGHDDDLAKAALRRSWELGITHWDTADVYGDGHAESLIGEMWSDVPRADVFLATKTGYDPGPFEHPYHPEQARRQIEGSLRRLRVETIDVYYLHHCDFGPGDRYLDDALAVVHEARDAGKIRFVGLSDWDPVKLRRLAERVDPDVVQPHRNVSQDRWASSGLQAWAEDRDAGVAFFSPIRHGLLLGKYDRPTEFPEGDFRANDPAFRDADALGRLREHRARLAERFADRPEPVLEGLLGALLEDAPTACVLLGQRNPRQVESAARVAAEPVSPEDAAWVRDLYRDIPG